MTMPECWQGASMKLFHIPPRIGRASPIISAAPKATDNFYRSPEWRALATKAKREARYRCAECGKDCSANPRELIADHIVERRDGGADLDPSNVQCLCAEHHNTKTSRARTERTKVWP